MKMTRQGAVEHLLASLDDGIRQFRSSGLESLCTLVDLISACEGKIVVTGVGKSGIIAHKIAATLASTKSPAVFLNAAEALHGDMGVVCHGDIVIMISSSGATDELLRMIPSLRRIGVTLVAFLNKTQSPLASQVDHTVPIPVPCEGDSLNLAPMCSSTMALIAGDSLAAMLQSEHGLTKEDFALFHPGGSLGRSLLLTAGDVMVAKANVGQVREESTFDEVVVELTRYPLGIVAVVNDHDEICGVISDGDVRRAVLERNYEILSKDLMSSDPVTIEKDASLGAVLELMERPERKVYALLVENAGRLEGVVRMHDVVGG